MLNEGTPLDQTTCHLLVIRYLLGQGWQLADPAVLAADVWPALAGRHLAGATAVEEVYHQIATPPSCTTIAGKAPRPPGKN